VFEQVEKRHCDAAAECLALAMLEESQTKALKISYETWLSFSADYLPRLAQNQLAFCAMDEDKCVGLCTAFEWKAFHEMLDSDMEPGKFSSEFAPMDAFVSQVLKDFNKRHTDLFSDVSVQMAYIDLLAVLPSHYRKGIGANVTRLCLQNLKDKGFTGVVVAASSHKSQPLFRQFGFKTDVEVPNATFEFNGEFPFREDKEVVHVMQLRLRDLALKTEDTRDQT